MPSVFYRTIAVLIFLLPWMFFVNSSQAQIVMDGSMGVAGPLSGPHYQIPSTLGQIYGPNLFHSFKDFNLASGQSATFSGPGSISNILSRVTGGTPSTINGSINSTIAGANLFFLNPSGIVFGPKGQVNVGGSFVASTADYLRFKDGSTFGVSGSGSPSPTLLSSAPPSAFGFLNPQPAPIHINGSGLRVKPGQSLSLVGGNIRLNGGVLRAPDGKVNLVSVASAGEAALEVTEPTSTVDLQSFGKLGNIALRDALIVVRDSAGASAGGPESSVLVRGANLTLNNSSVLARNLGTTSGGAIDVGLSGGLKLTNGSMISTTTEGSGSGADISIKADSVMLETDSHLGTLTKAEGKGGNVAVDAKYLRVVNDGLIFADTDSSGDGGNIGIKADNVLLDGKNHLFLTGIGAGTYAETEGGKGGDINIESKTLRILNGADISAYTYGSGNGGNITIKADNTILDGENIPLDEDDIPFPASINAGTSAETEGGKGGDINIESKTLRILNGAYITSDTSGRESGGSVNIKADTVLLHGDGSNISASTDAQGPGGDITVECRTLQLRNGAGIFNHSSGIFEASPDGGSITIKADTVLLRGAGTGIGVPTGARSKGGDIIVESRTLKLLDGAFFLSGTSYPRAQSGNILIKSDTVVLDGRGNRATIQTHTAGVGGDITIESRTLQLLNGGDITALTLGRGEGSSISIKSDTVVLDGQGNSSWGTGIGTHPGEGDEGSGDISIDAQHLRIVNNASINGTTLSGSHASDITIWADTLLLDKGSIAAETWAKTRSGKGGSITVESETLDILNGGDISATTHGVATGGSITIKADTVLLNGQGASNFTGIDAQTQAANGGKGGGITVEAEQLQIVNGARISASTLGTGRSGDITITVGTANLDGQGSSRFTGIDAQTQGDDGGKGGNITVNAEHLAIKNDAAISASTFGTGGGGSIIVKAGDVTLSNSGLLTATALGGGDAGIIVVDAADTVSLSGSSEIRTSAAGSSGGNITISAGNGILLRDSKISGSAADDGGDLRLKAGRIVSLYNSELNATAGGNGGNIIIGPRSTKLQFVVLNNGHLKADAVNGNGGNIKIQGEVFVPSSDSSVTASSQFAAPGTILVAAPDPNLGAGLRRLPSTPLSAEDSLQAPCFLRRGKVSTFKVRRQGSTLPEPSGPLPNAGIK